VVANGWGGGLIGENCGGGNQINSDVRLREQKGIITKKGGGHSGEQEFRVR